MGLDNSFGDGEAKTRALTIGAGGLPVPIKYPRQLIGRYTPTLVEHRDNHAVGTFSRQYHDLAAAFRKLDRIPDEVRQRLLDPFAISHHLRQAALDLQVEMNPLLLNEGAQRLQ